MIRCVSSLFITICIVSRISIAELPRPWAENDVVPNGLGVNIHFIDARPGEMEMLVDAGFRWVRMDFQWASTETERGKYNFADYDRLVADLEKHKVRALFILDYSNPLYEAEASVVTEAGRQAFARWAAAAAKHYQGHSILWEIWNEPNGSFWKPKANVQEYAALALAASKAIRAAAPNEAIIGPATSEVDLKFLEACFQAGLLNWWDAVSVHPYRKSAPETAVPEYEKLRALIAKYAPPGKQIPILSGEWGYSSGWRNFDDALQGRYLARQWLVNVSNGVPISIWYDWHDDGPDPKEPEHHFGTVYHSYRAGETPVYAPKPAYLAAKTLTSVLAGYRYEKRLDAGNADDHVLAFRKGNARRVVAWTTAKKAHSVKVTLPSGKYDVITHTGEGAGEPAVSQGDSLEVQIDESPRYLVPRGNDKDN